MSADGMDLVGKCNQKKPSKKELKGIAYHYILELLFIAVFFFQGDGGGVWPGCFITRQSGGHHL